MVPCLQSRDKKILLRSLVCDIIDFDFEKRKEDPKNLRTWYYVAAYRGMVFRRVQGPKGISEWRASRARVRGRACRRHNSIDD